MAANVNIVGPAVWKVLFALAYIVEITLARAIKSHPGKSKFVDQLALTCKKTLTSTIHAISHTFPCPHCTKSCTHFVQIMNEEGITPEKSVDDFVVFVRGMETSESISILHAPGPVKLISALRDRVNHKLQTQHMTCELEKVLSPALFEQVRTKVEEAKPPHHKLTTVKKRLMLMPELVSSEDVFLVLHGFGAGFVHGEEGIGRHYMNFVKGMTFVTKFQNGVIASVVCPAESSARKIRKFFGDHMHNLMSIADESTFATREALMNFTDNAESIFFEPEMRGVRRKSIAKFLSVQCSDKTCA